MIITFEGQQHKFPDDFTDNDIQAALASAPQQTKQPDVAQDVLTQAKTGLLEGGLSLPDIRKLPGQFYNYMFPPKEQTVSDQQRLEYGHNAAYDPAVQARIRGDAVEPVSPAAGLTELAQATALGKFEAPQTPAGEYARTTAGFATNAALPGGMVRRAAQVVIPGLTSETAGQVARSQGANETPYRAAGAFVSPGGPRPTGAGTVGQLKANYRSVINSPVIRDMPAPEAARGTVPRTELAGPGYHIANDAPVPGLGDKIKRDLNQAHFGPETGAPARSWADDINNMPRPTIGDLIDKRQAIRLEAHNARVSNPGQARGLDVAKRGIDDFIGERVPEFSAANRDYAIAKQSETIQGKRDYAKLTAAAAASGMNEGNRQRQLMVALLRPENVKARAGMSPETLAGIQGVAEGTIGMNAARRWANRLGGGGGMWQGIVATGGAGLGAGGGYAAGGTEGAGYGAAAGLGLAGLGRGLKGLENTLTRRQVDRLDELIRSQAPLSVKMAPALKDEQRRQLLIQLLARNPGALASIQPSE